VILRLAAIDALAPAKVDPIEELVRIVVSVVLRPRA
jgi:hypothetical protein